MKPQYIMVGHDGSIKLIGFCIASVYGTKQYYSPEQTQGQIVSPVADIYPLGNIMYEMLTGRTPFDGDTPVAMQHIHDTPESPSQLDPNIPAALEDIIMRCLEKEPDNLYRDGSQLARALEVLV